MRMLGSSLVWTARLMPAFPQKARLDTSLTQQKQRGAFVPFGVQICCMSSRHRAC